MYLYERCVVVIHLIDPILGPASLDQDHLEIDTREPVLRVVSRILPKLGVI